MNKEIVKKYSQTNKFGKLLDMQYRLDETGDIIYDVTITEKHLATTTAAHGGLLAAMMDGVVGVAAAPVANPPLPRTESDLISPCASFTSH